MTHVVGGSAGDEGFSGPGRRVKLQAATAQYNPSKSRRDNVQGVLQRVVYFEDRGLVAAAVAVVRGGEDGNYVALL
jgi:hypothetical protein